MKFESAMKFAAWVFALVPGALGIMPNAAMAGQCMQTFPPCGTVLRSHIDDPYHGIGKVEYYREGTLGVMNYLLKQQTDMTPLARSMMNALRSQALAGKSGAGKAGRAVAGMLGVGNCTRHFYNNSSDFFAVALMNSGTCAVNGGAVGNICLIAPHTTATLSYSNMGNVGARILIAAQFGINGYGVLHRAYDMNAVGCRILHNGRTHPIAVNDPADGDVSTCGRGGERCESHD